MHELTIAANLVAVSCDEARRAGATRITAVRCRIGEWRSVDDALLREAFAVAGDGTPCAAATLEIEKIPMCAWCANCQWEFPVRAWVWNCPRCGGEGDLLDGGAELELRSIDAEVDHDNSGGAEVVAAK